MFAVSAILFSISANIDTFVLGLSYGIKKQHISLFTNFIISLITFLGTLLSIGLASKLTLLISLPVARVAGSTLLLLLGLYYCLKYLLHQIHSSQEDESPMAVSLEADAFPVTSASANSAPLTGGETIALGLTLTMNNAGMGIGASFAGIHLLLTSCFTFLFSALFLIAGNHLGSLFSDSFLFRLGDLICGLIMILLGIIQMLVSF